MRLNFKKIGEQGQPLIILHGVFGLLDNWLTVSKSISEAGYQLYLVDQRNHGRSPHQAPMDYPSFAADLAEFIEEEGIKSPVLIGHSMGGKTVMEYAVTHPGTFDKLVVVDIGPKQYPIHHKKILEGLNAIDLDTVGNRQDADDQLSPYEPSYGVRQFLLKNLYRKEDGSFGWRFNLPVLTSDMSKIGAEINTDVPVQVPVLFIRGEKSHYILDEDWEDILKIFPAAHLETIAHAGHWVQSEQPKAFVSVLLKFLKE